MRICFFTSTFLPMRGGVEYAVHYLAKNLIKSGHQVTVLVGGHKQKEDDSLPYPVHRYRGAKGLISSEKLSAIYLVLEKIRTKFDVLHAHRTYPTGYVGAKLKHLLKVPLIVTPYGDDIQKVPDLNYGMRLKPQIESKIENTLSKADVVVSISSSNKEEILKLGTSENKIYDIPLGVETKSFSVSKINIKERLNLPLDTKLVLAVGVNRERKGYPYLIQAMKKVILKQPNARMMIVGRGTKDLLPLVEKAELKEFIFLLDDISDEEKFSFYTDSDVFVSPSLMEAFGIATLEAMAACLPIVATNIPGSEDLVTNHINGFLIPPESSEALAEKIILLLKDERLRKTMGKKSFEISRQYDWKIITKKYIEVYEQMLQRYKRYMKG